ncbi:leucine-rich repeat domain-containing protein [Bifidobacterium sp. ESL0798]|uniref:leucine-rich repeat domain-containing protein n=1 Tax=Bifidobacterium sp. ESL0798 TaxID=2983235 RepID=UPI0023F7E282|nr:leucine-rich repeat domain-containing protein [Bifidobacterium sp. ESL0798]WEV73618.1 leucine-rich repeat domain-containing protein [Bifidobacterium sp. ESL0798]
MRFSRKGVRRSLAACAAGVAAVAMLVPGSANAVETRGNCVVGTSTIAQCFPDAQLAQDVAAKGGVAVGDVFTQHIVDTVTEIGGFYRSLEGAQYLTNLATINSRSSGVTDLSPLSGLRHLTKITFEHSPITDLSPLAGMAQLRRLDFDYSGISDLTPLSGLTNLEALRLDRNDVTDITPLSGLTKLRFIHAWENHISDLRPLKGVAAQLSWDDPDTGPDSRILLPASLHPPLLRRRGFRLLGV